uniref:F-box/LRR-repeat protein 13-like n=1 Tax=Cicer arietinum TaxID=3827 RepID=A0A3Q7YBN5_CICAR|nr:F-box/LRR-repeat protein 13-like [Cicer arietinum]
MSIPSSKKEVNEKGRVDFISQLPDDILFSIISSLSIDDVVKTSVLSKRWIHLRNNVSHFDFDCTHMFKALPKFYNRISYNKFLKSLATEEHARKYSEIVNTILHQHIGDYLINSVLPAFESCEKLKILKLEKMSMVDSIINGILKNCFGLEKFCLIESDGFDSLKIENKNLKYLELLLLDVEEIDVNVEELHVLVIDSLRCPPKCLRINSHNLWNFSYTCNLDPLSDPQDILQTREIFENCSNLLVHKPTNIFRNLSTLSIDLDLNNIRDILAFSYILPMCFHLNTLEITVPVEESSVFTDTFDDCALPFPNSMFWENREVPDFVCMKLKFVTVKRFTGKALEISFLKHLITRAYMMKKLQVICDSTVVNKGKYLWSLRRASTNLSILFKSKI